jgi:hypothetical protein
VRGVAAVRENDEARASLRSVDAHQDRIRPEIHHGEIRLVKIVHDGFHLDVERRVPRSTRRPLVNAIT